MRELVLAGAVAPIAFMVLAAWAGVAGDGPGMVAAGLLAAISWTVWVFLATWALPRREGKR